MFSPILSLCLYRALPVCLRTCQLISLPCPHFPRNHRGYSVQSVVIGAGTSVGDVRFLIATNDARMSIMKHDVKDA